MNAPLNAHVLSLAKFGIGQPVSRKEDPVLLRGEGRPGAFTPAALFGHALAGALGGVYSRS